MAKVFGDLSPSEQETFLLKLLNPNDPLYNKVGKRGLDEILGPGYDVYKRTPAQIRKDIMRIGKRSKPKDKKVQKAFLGGSVKATGTFKGTF